MITKHCCGFICWVQKNSRMWERRPKLWRFWAAPPHQPVKHIMLNWIFQQPKSCAPSARREVQWQCLRLRCCRLGRCQGGIGIPQPGMATRVSSITLIFLIGGDEDRDRDQDNDNPHPDPNSDSNSSWLLEIAFHHSTRDAQCQDRSELFNSRARTALARKFHGLIVTLAFKFHQLV